MLQPDTLTTGTNGTTGVGVSYPIPTPQQITELVDSHERYTEDLRQRMEADWELAILAGSYDEFDSKGYRLYHSNEPMTYLDKMNARLGAGRIKLTVPIVKAQREKREREAAKERFAIGILRSNDERLLRMGQPRLLHTLVGFINLRGWYCGRRTLVKDPQTGDSYVDITAWDPLHVSWGMGPKGLRWVCNKSKKTAAEVAVEYPDLDLAALGGNHNGSNNGYFQPYPIDDSVGLDVYDWWDEQNNMVVIGDQYAKPPTPHGDPNGVPSFFGAVGYLPLVQSRTLSGSGNLKYQGESVYAPNRNIYKKLSLVMSTMYQLVMLSRNQAFWIGSDDGQKQLKNNPSLEGSQFSLRTGETFNIIPLLEMSRDTGAFLGLISAEIQRGALPYSTYGQLAFQLSGYAVNLLKQAEDAPTLPRQQGVETALQQIVNGICDQFATGAFGGMHLQGWDRNRDWFDMDFTPDMMMGLPAVEVELRVETPQDEMQNVQMMKLTTEGPFPALPWREGADRYLHVEDLDSMADAIKEEQGARMLPEAYLMDTLMALEKKGRPELAMFYYGQLIKQGIILPPRPWMQNETGAQGAGTPGFSPEGLSAPEQGKPDTGSPPNPQAGPNMLPGSPRPGAVAPVVRAWGVA